MPSNREDGDRSRRGRPRRGPSRRGPSRRGRPRRGVLRVAALLGAVLLVAVGAACGSSGHSSSTATSRVAANEVVIKNFAFVPQTITVKAGTTVTWVNEDPVAHSIVADHDTFPSSSILNHGDKYSHVFNTAGTFPYICGVHPFMTGTVVVTS